MTVVTRYAMALSLLALATACSSEPARLPASSVTEPGGATGSTATTRPTPGPGEVIVADGFLLGWWDGSGWQSAGPDRREPGDPPLPLALASPYTFVSIDGRQIEANLGSSTQECIAPEPVFVDVPEAVRDMVGVARGIDPLPRPVEQIGAAPEHEASLRSWLEEEGVADPELSLDRVTRVDLEGDGVDEVLIEASRITEGSLLDNPAGDYSVVLVRHLVDEQVRTSVIRGYAVTAKDDSAASTVLLPTSELNAVADLNGNDHFEIVVRTGYYEGGGIALYAWEVSHTREVLRAVCGS